MSKTTQAFEMDGLESRLLLSHGWIGGGHLGRSHMTGADDPAVQADLLKIQQDRRQLAEERQALGQTLADDRKAIRDAIQALNSQLSPLRQQLRDDVQAAWTTIRADLRATWQDRGDAAKLAVDKAKLQADRASAQTTLQADRDAIQAVIDNDTTVQAAKQKLEGDQKPITDDLAQLKADQDQLRQDVQNARGNGGTGTTAARGRGAR